MVDLNNKRISIIKNIKHPGITKQLTKLKFLMLIFRKKSKLLIKIKKCKYAHVHKNNS